MKFGQKEKETDWAGASICILALGPWISWISEAFNSTYSSTSQPFSSLIVRILLLIFIHCSFHACLLWREFSAGTLCDISIISPRSIYVVTNVRFHSFLWPRNIPLCPCTTSFYPAMSFPPAFAPMSFLTLLLCSSFPPMCLSKGGVGTLCCQLQEGIEGRSWGCWTKASLCRVLQLCCPEVILWESTDLFFWSKMITLFFIWIRDDKDPALEIFYCHKCI